MGRRMNAPDDPILRRAVQKMTDAFDRMAQTRAEVERTPLSSIDEPRNVDGALMFAIASLASASPELRAYAGRVAAGECSWDEIETLSRPVPPEIGELKRDTALIWFPAKQTPPPDDEEPYRIPWQ